MKTTLTFERATKNTLVYKNDSDGAPIPSLYIAKSAFKDPENPPKKIEMSSPEVK